MTNPSPTPNSPEQQYKDYMKIAGELQSEIGNLNRTKRDVEKLNRFLRPSISRVAILFGLAQLTIPLGIPFALVAGPYAVFSLGRYFLQRNKKKDQRASLRLGDQAIRYRMGEHRESLKSLDLGQVETFAGQNSDFRTAYNNASAILQKAGKNDLNIGKKPTKVGLWKGFLGKDPYVRGL